MIKIFLPLIAIHGVLCAPAAPFAEYGIPAANNLAETRLPWVKVEPPIQGAENLGERRQVPEVYPGTRNLGEKSIPDTITLKKTPTPFSDFETPRYESESFAPATGYYPASSYAPEIPSARYGIPYYREQPEAQYYYYPPAQEETYSEVQAPEVYPSPQPALYPVETDGGDSAPVEIAPGDKFKVQDGHGQYSHGFASPDGTQVEESGHLITTNGGWEYVIAKEGSYNYNSPEGIPISVKYVADHNGFRIISQSFGRR